MVAVIGSLAEGRERTQAALAYLSDGDFTVNGLREVCGVLAQMVLFLDEQLGEVCDSAVFISNIHPVPSYGDDGVLDEAERVVGDVFGEGAQVVASDPKPLVEVLGDDDDW